MKSIFLDKIPPRNSIILCPKKKKKTQYQGDTNVKFYLRKQKYH